MPDLTNPPDASPEPPSATATAPVFWSSLPGILTGLATVLTAATGLFVALRSPSSAVAAGSPPVATAPAASPGASTATPTAPAASHPHLPPGGLVTSGSLRSPLVAQPARRALIQDPDGFSNLRAAPGTRSAIVTRLPQGQALQLEREEDGWWLVHTPDGQSGWVHGSRLKGVP